MSMNMAQQMEFNEVKSLDIKPYPLMTNGYNVPLEYYSNSVPESNFSPTSPTFSHHYSPYNQTHPQRFNGYNTYPQSPVQLVSPMRSPTQAYPFHQYTPIYQRPSLPPQTFFHGNEQERRQLRDSVPPPSLSRPPALMPAAFPDTPLRGNEQVDFLAQNPQYLSGLAGQNQGNPGKVSRAIAAQLFARDENTERFPCTICGQTFKRINGLKRHLMMHLHIKPYKCEMCSRGFCRIDVYKRHVQRGRCVKE
ncbi:hypothetical protein DSO57_1011877 [Entomophthora muscae]|uniref:Uncharacterized protein n=1 Tax=Entomophthora muscae TaxID=34485 RepID=A0ACC2RX59_9FUNG|nr:hypothetical protein DSO57_1011877 [Entomophthora muscae]